MVTFRLVSCPLGQDRERYATGGRSLDRDCLHKSRIAGLSALDRYHLSFAHKILQKGHGAWPYFIMINKVMYVIEVVSSSRRDDIFFCRQLYYVTSSIYRTILFIVGINILGWPIDIVS